MFLRNEAQRKKLFKGTGRLYRGNKSVRRTVSNVATGTTKDKVNFSSAVFSANG